MLNHLRQQQEIEVVLRRFELQPSGAVSSTEPASRRPAPPDPNHVASTVYDELAHTTDPINSPVPLADTDHLHIVTLPDSYNSQSAMLCGLG